MPLLAALAPAGAQSMKKIFPIMFSTPLPMQGGAPSIPGHSFPLENYGAS